MPADRPNADWRVREGLERVPALEPLEERAVKTGDRLSGGQTVLWAPHPGPQTAFLQSTAHEALYGGMAGGGKSDALLYGALRQVHHPKYRALILRRTFPELRGLMDRALTTFAQTRGRWHEQSKRWTWPSGATVEFGYCASYGDVMQ